MSRPPSLHPLPSFPEYPPNPNFVIPRAVAESISACQHINQKIQRPLHSSMDTATSRSMTALVGRRCPRPSSLHPLPSFPEYPPNPNLVIPRAVGESISACQHINQKIQRPLHSSMDTATSRSMTALVGRRCPRPSSLHPLPSFPEYPPNPNLVIPRAVAESISACQRINQKIQRPLHSSMDTATSRSMTALVGRRCPVPRHYTPSRHSRSTRRTQTSSFRAQSRNPSPPANASTRKSSALCTPPWILRLRTA